jgi:hypothetical protein
LTTAELVSGTEFTIVPVPDTVASDDETSGIVWVRLPVPIPDAVPEPESEPERDN